MQNFVEARYNELLRALESARLPHIAQPFDEKGLECIADYYFAKGDKTKEAEEKAQTALNRFALNFDATLYKEESNSLQREAAGKLLADFLYHFHVHAAVKHDLSNDDGYSALDSLANDLIPRTPLGLDGCAAFLERLNFNRKLEKILTFKANEKTPSHLEKFVARHKNQIANIENRDSAFLAVSTHYSYLFELFFTELYTHRERVHAVAEYLQKTQLQYFFEFLESQNHADMNLEFGFAKGRFYKVIRSLYLSKESLPEIMDFKKYQQLTSNFIEDMPKNQQQTLIKAINAPILPSTSERGLYREVHPEQQARPKGMPASAIMIGLTAITYGIRKVVSWMSFSMYKFSNQKDVKAWLSHEKRHYIAENWSFNSWKPAVFWALTTTVTIGLVFGGLATAGILPLSMTLFTFPLWIPFIGGTGPSLGLMLLTSIIPAASSIAGKIASFFYKDDVERSIEDELDIGDLQALIAHERQELVLDKRESPSTQPKNVIPEEDDDIELSYNPAAMKPLK